MLGAAQLEQLRARGWTTIAGAITPEQQVDMLDRVWAFLETRGLRRHDAGSWPEAVPKLQPLRNAGVFDAFLGETVDAIADQLMGAGQWTTLGVRPQALITMPSEQPWQLPHKVWHFDLPGRGPTDKLAAVRYFGLVDDVVPRGGGTLVVEGSHELVRRSVDASRDNDAGSSADVRRRLRGHDFFDRLAQPEPDVGWFMGTGDTIDGVHIRVGEIVGRAGDLVVMHPWLLHNLSTNSSDLPRIVMSHSLYSSEVSFYGGPT